VRWPCRRATRVPIYNLGGWFEMTAASAAINRFHSVPNPGSRLTLGPWTHQRVEISPGRERRAQCFYEKWDVVRFFQRDESSPQMGADGRHGAKFGRKKSRLPMSDWQLLQSRQHPKRGERQRIAGVRRKI